MDQLLLPLPKMPLSEITPKQPRWEPAENPDDIVVPGLNTAEPINDQIEYIEHGITKLLQVANNPI